MGKKSKKQGKILSTQQRSSTKGKEKEKENDGSKKKAKFSIDQLLDKAEEYVDTFEYEMAQRFCQRALEIDPDNVRALETSGTLLLELDNSEAAKHCFGRAIELLPDKGHSKYMYMGQLMVGDEAIQCFYKGIEIMTKMLQEQKEAACGVTEEEPEVSWTDVSNAYCSVAEIYLTDACLEENAESGCKECLDKAIESDKDNPEAYQLMASYWLSKDDKNASKEMIEKGVSLWLPQWREADKPEGAKLDPVQVCPLSYPARMTASKTLIEVENYDTAAEILELLLDEEDEVVEVWYLLGWLNFLQGDDYKSNARYYLKRAAEVAKKTGFDDKEVSDHVKMLLEELGAGVDEEAAINEEDDYAEQDTDDEMEVENGENDMHH